MLKRSWEAGEADAGYLWAQLRLADAKGPADPVAVQAVAIFERVAAYGSSPHSGAPFAMYASRAVQFHPHGGQSDFVWLSARTPHVGPQYVWCLTTRQNQEKYPPEIYYRPFPCS